MQQAATRNADNDLWPRLRRNAGIIVGGRMASGLVNLAAAAVAVRAVGLEAFGFVALLQAYVRLVAGLLAVPSWTAVTRYGAGMLERGATAELQRFIGLTIRLDLMAFALAVVVAVAAAPFVARWLDWPAPMAALAPWYALVIPFIAGSTAHGFLRLVDRYRVLAEWHAIGALVRLVGAGLVFGLGGGAAALALGWAAAGVVAGSFLVTVALTEARRRRLLPQMRGGFRAPAAGAPELWRFLAATKATGVVDTLVNQGTVLAVGGVLGATGASLMALVRQVTEALKKLGKLLDPIVLPELAVLEARGNRRAMRAVLGRTLLWGGAGLAAIVAALGLGGEALLAVLFGEAARAAAGLLLAAGAAAALEAAGFAIAPALLSTGRETSVFATTVVATAIFVPLLFALLGTAGLVGAGIALLVRQILLLAGQLWVARTALRSAGA